MAILPRRPLFLLVCAVALVGVLLGLLVPAPVRADVGPQPVLPGGSSIKPGEETPIQMAAEVVTMNVRPATEADNALVKLPPKTYALQGYPIYYPGIAEVEADFTMRNPTGAPVSLTVWFPLASALEKVGWRSDLSEVPSIEDFQVRVDGLPLDHAVRMLPNPQGSEQPPLPWASFPVTFPGGKDTLIHVSYRLPLQPSIKGNEMVLYYIFQTGAGWAGPIGQAELIVNLPYPASKETLALMPSGSLSLPPMYVPKPASLPSGGVLEGNQARWKWKDFEPGPQDDFAAWLLRPAKWQELQAARAAVQANPQDGRAWLNLAYVYHSLSLSWTNARLLFSPYYLTPCLEAYRKAADLLPEHPAAQAGLGLLALEPYLKTKNAPPEVMQYVQGKLEIARELEQKHPDLVKDAQFTSMNLENALNTYFYNDATATVDAVTSAAMKAVFDLTQTARVTRDYATLTVLANVRATNHAWRATDNACLVTAGAECTATAVPTETPLPRPTLAATQTPKPTHTSLAIPSATPQSPPPAVEKEGNGQSLVIYVAIGVIALVAVGYLVVKRLR